ncbi:PKD domain-containing protein [Methanosarcina acetivorans]|uniref:Cell surface protein n=1 Tax=Methanosarcina acetivorans (strain ATCC 35395 / DSM 2834 / JCM 12185 / C2A) TaxID=188937 RepID=Q8TJS9_METAC|nr:PKD domain-containing protein [Methanosarcina acetivorans]AAM07053.1 cell surface protein [Methanosarcina acetivorans C2A]
MKRIFLILCIAALMCMTGLASAAEETVGTVANFTTNTTSGSAPLTVQFTDISTNATSWAWDFENDGTIDSTDQNPVHTYSTEGIYTVNFTVSNAGGNASEVKTGYISVSEPLPSAPVANFSADITSGNAPLTVNFTDQSTGTVSSYSWDFENDGVVDSTEQTPSYIYTSAGTYTVNLTVTNAAGSDSEVKINYITVEGTGTEGLADTAWPKYHYDLNNTGRSPYIGPQTGNVVWTFNAGGSLQYNSPAIGADGTIYTGSCGTHEFYAINPNGTLKWTFRVGYTWQRFYGSPAIGTDGTIYTGNRDGNLYALNPDGTLKWSYATANDIFKSPTIGPDGTIYIASCDGYLHAVNPDSTFKWKVRWQNGNHEDVNLIGSPAIGPDGTIYIGSSSEAVFHAFNPDGTEKWNYTYTTGSTDYISFYGSPAIGSDGTVYIGNRDSKLFALNPDGTLKWDFSIAQYDQILCAPAIGTDGTLYARSLNGNFYAIYPNGTLKWSCSVGYSGHGSPVIGADGAVYVINSAGRICALNPDGTLKWDSNIGGSYCSPAIGSDSTLYVCAGNALYAFRTEAPVANFSAEPTTGDIPLTVQFTDESVKDPISWLWDFGDGDDTNATMQNPMHTYNAVGTYNVTLTATNIAGNGTESKTGYITVLEAVIPVANFSAEPTTGDVPLTVRFTDESAKNPTSWLWDFGDGDDTNATMQNPVHTYNAAGTYTVTLKATNFAGSNAELKTGYITVLEAVTPVANFSADMTSGDVPLTVQFTDESANNPTSWTWDFGDGSTSDQQNPSHRYVFAGNYTVTLTATNAGGSGTGTKTDYITVNAVERIKLADSAWPKFGYDLNNTGQSPYAGPQSNNVVWTYTAGDNFYIGGSTIGPDGTIYICNADQNLYAFNPNGTLKWSYNTEGYCYYCTPAIDSDGVIYVGNRNEKLDAINPNGTLKWTSPTGDYVYGSPAIGSDGIIYVGCRDGNLYALFPDGTLMWTCAVGGRFNYVSPAIAADGTIYAGNYEDNKLYAINSNGIIKWSYETGGRIYNSPAIAADGTVYVGSYDSNLYAINPDGTLKWNYTTGAQIYGAPSIAADGTVYIGSYDHNLYAINPDGTLKWNYYADGEFRYSQPVIGVDGTVYIGDSSGKFYGISPGGTLKWDYTTGGRVYGPASIGSDGTLYIGSYDKKLYAFRDAETPVADFSAVPISGGVPLTVRFTDESAGYPTSWSWDFGDGENSTAQNPAHIYTASGTYNVTLTITNDAGSDTVEKIDYITVTSGGSSGESAPIADFNVALYTDDCMPHGTAPITVSFTDNSTGNVSVYIWEYRNLYTGSEWTEFGSGAQNPTDIEFSDVGTYDIRLTVSNSGGSSNRTIEHALTAGMSHDYLTTIQNGTVSGDLYIDSRSPWTTTANYSYTLPASGDDIVWARVFVNDYSGSGSGNGALQLKTELDSDGDGTFETVLGVEECNIQSDTDQVVYPLNDHVSKVYSDYEAWYDVADLLNSTTPNIRVTASDIGVTVGSDRGFDGRIKGVTLVVAYNDGDSDEVNYIVNHGNDWMTGSSSTTFDASTFASGWTEAEIKSVSFSSTDASYTLDGNSIAASSLGSGGYYEFNSFNVTSALTPAASNTFGYTNQGVSFKICLAALTVGYGNESAGAPVADFTGTPTSGDAPLTVQFTDNSSGATEWSWDFGDGDDTNATEQNPVHTYAAEGNYSVKLTVTNAGGSDDELKTDYITVLEPSTPEPVAMFTADATSGTVPLTVNFTDQSTGSPTSWFWDFGDGANSTEQNPVHTYSAEGNYTVNLTVENAAGTDFELKTDYIEVTEASGSTVTLYFDPTSSSVAENESTEISVVASNFPAGLSGYNLTVAIDDPTIAEIIDIEYPSWALITQNSTLPATSIYMKTVDLEDAVKEGAADVVLATLTVSGKEKGSANLSIGVKRLEEDSGDSIEPALLTGTIEVTLLSPLPDQEYTPRDLDGDGLYEDLTGNGEFSFVDIVAYFHNMDWIEENMPVEYFDFNGNGRIDFDDVVDMFAMI